MEIFGSTFYDRDLFIREKRRLLFLVVGKVELREKDFGLRWLLKEILGSLRSSYRIFPPPITP